MNVISLYFLFNYVIKVFMVNENAFVTKPCSTTYTYMTTYLEDATGKIVSREKVVSYTATQDRASLRITPTLTSGYTQVIIISDFGM